ncbi:hypothetical protein [Rhizomonospora bruguierae]|uniref:hypothetical protein n=1 Tax=Rhizomonospora bruguierae TaxID=1581705 RepID=UPI001BD10B66|nr:hypothetical protein [Micromonospora sp. NBRC 107566]
MFLFPGSVPLAGILDLLTVNLAQIGALAVARRANVYWLTRTGVVEYQRRAATRGRRRRG